MGSLSDNYARANAALEPLSIDSDPVAAAAITDSSYNPEQWIEIGQAQAAVHRWIQTLPERDRALLQRLFWSDESQADIARSLNVSRAAVSKHMSRLAREGRASLAPHRYSLLLH